MSDYSLESSRILAETEIGEPYNPWFFSTGRVAFDGTQTITSAREHLSALAESLAAFVEG
jgi:hypothetical protein